MTSRRWFVRCEPPSRVPLPGPFKPERQWWTAGDEAFERFCEGAFLVDRYERRSLLGSAWLALRAWIPPELARLDLVNNLHDYENIVATFRLLEDRWGAVRAWRCDVDWVMPDQRIYSLAGPCPPDMLLAMQASAALTPVDATTWDDWEWIDAPLCIHNDRTMWFRCTA